EIRKLTWTDHLDLDAGLIRLEASEVKNAAGKSFPFAAHPALKNLVVRQCERALKARVKWLFPRADGRRLGNFHRQWTRACREAGVPGKVVHDLRRTAVRNPSCDLVSTRGWRWRWPASRPGTSSTATTSSARQTSQTG